MNIEYKDNVTAIMQVNKKYVDDKVEEVIELVADYDISTDVVSQLSTSATAPSDVRSSSLIQVGGNCVKYAPSTASDSSVSKMKSIPLSTFTLGVDYVGGYTKKSENLWSLGTFDTSTGGSTISINSLGLSAGNYTITNTATIGNWVVIVTDSDNNTIQYGNTGVANAITFTIPSGTYNARLYFNQANTNIDFMLNSGSTALPYQPYFTGLRSAKVSEIKVEGNLLNLSDVAETTTNGITYKVENGVITLNGTASSNTNIDLIINHTILNGTYYLESFIGTLFPSVANLVLRDANSNIINIDLRYRSGNSFTSNKETYILRLYFSNGAVLNNLVVKPMLVKGSTAPTSFIPYVAPITKQIPSAILNNEYYGLGLSSSLYNSLNLVSKKLNKKLGIVDLGTLSWSINNPNISTSVFVSEELTDCKLVLPNELANIKTAPYNVDTRNNVANATTDKNIGIGAYNVAGNKVYIYDSAYTNATTFKTAMSGVYLVYELEIEEDIDMSSYLDDSFKTFNTNNQYTDIEMVNEYDYDIPNKLSYFGIIKETLVESMTITNVGEQPQTINLADTNVQDGWSVSNSIYNYRADRERKRHKKVGKIHLGDYTWNYNTTSGKERFSTNISDIKIPNNDDSTITLLINRPYTTVSFNTIKNTTTDLLIGVGQTGNIIIRDFNYTDTTTFKQAMSGVYLYYELATEVVEDLDVVYDSHYIPLKSGGSITFNNTNAQQCHNTIRYTIMEEKQ